MPASFSNADKRLAELFEQLGIVEVAAQVVEMLDERFPQRQIDAFLRVLGNILRHVLAKLVVGVGLNRNPNDREVGGQQLALIEIVKSRHQFALREVPARSEI